MVVGYGDEALSLPQKTFSRIVIVACSTEIQSWMIIIINYWIVKKRKKVQYEVLVVQAFEKENFSFREFPLVLFMVEEIINNSTPTQNVSLKFKKFLLLLKQQIDFQLYESFSSLSWIAPVLSDKTLFEAQTKNTWIIEIYSQ